MAIFGRITARQRLRRATRESLAVPAFSAPVDCTPWVTGGLWPAELSTAGSETASLADYLRTDLERIARSANDELKVIRRAGLPDATRQAEEARVIAEARARAVRRVESTMRQLHTVRAAAGNQRPVPLIVGPDVDATQVIPAVTDAESPPGPTFGVDPRRRWRVAEPRDAELAAPPPAPDIQDTQVIPAVTEVALPAAPTTEDAPAPPTPQPEAAGSPEPAVRTESPAETAPARGESDIDRLNRLLEFVVRQEPRLNWAVADRAEGATVLVTDLAHGWVPPGIALPAGVRLLGPGRRSGRVVALLGEAVRVAAYAPGDSLRRSPDLAATKSSPHARGLPAIDDLPGALCAATHRRDGLPGMVHAMATMAAGGNRVVDQEADVLRVHLDTARYQLLAQYPSVDSGLLLNCLLLAATEAFVVGDFVSANYHFAWFRELDARSQP
ncbi:putative transmembrane protein [Mycobacterium bohemicum DSM 44277]|uniref:Vegetative cell wall protein n=2 Tax=Mycobacterium bohemicum TaxID=56425 RepID=A0A1X1RAQ9_MYCBE|nr:DUF5631 domain-containing protein [Mycobacterium bohemicum]ORV02349.1 hypothetical protein AWB93_05900 [Mycobacterium bohemicum]CPR12781.1 putative transmembrane protein [Mycobacterium bohemicum DSM 44277]